MTKNIAKFNTNLTPIFDQCFHFIQPENTRKATKGFSGVSW